MAMQNHCLIDGDWVIGHDQQQNLNPSDLSDVVSLYGRADQDQTHQAIAAAKAAFPRWRQSTPQQRADILQEAGRILLDRAPEIGRILAREEGKTLAEGIGETIRAGQIFQFFAGQALRPGGELIPSTRPNVSVEIRREPLGVVGLITPWNFPIAIPAWKIAPALAYGNCVVLKPAELTPACAYELAVILKQAGIPDGVFNLVIGKGSIVGQTLIDSLDVHAISFTGSVETGKHIAAAAVAGGKKIQMEMGGKNPLIVLDDADLDTAIACALNGAFFSTGQRCTASSRLIITDTIHDKFVTALKEHMHALTIDNALAERVDIGPVANQDQFEQNQNYLKIAGDEGGNVDGGAVLQRATQGYFMAPALVTETRNDMRINQEEVFGPIASTIRVKDYEEALHVANDTRFGLSSGICTTSLKYARHFKANSEAGMVMVNLPTAGVDYHAPFGGRKSSSYGPREQGSYAQEFYSQVKTAYETV